MLTIHFRKQDTYDSYILEYIWIDGRGNLRSKCRTVYPDFNLEEYKHFIVAENWNYDGSSTYQASTEDSEIVLMPVAHYANPFFKSGRSFLILCDTYRQYNSDSDDGSYVPTDTNFRCAALHAFSNRPELKPWFGIEQEYFMTRISGTRISGTRISGTPLAFFGSGAEPEPQGDYYCGVGSRTVTLRKLAEKHYEYCLQAGLKISGINAEVAPSQWEFQIGPCEGIAAGDELWVARYILHKLSEEFGVCISFDPKPLANPWNGSGLHTNFSTEETRKNSESDDNGSGLKNIYKYIDRLSKRHDEHLCVYGDNSERLNGTCETSDARTFSYAAGSRGASIRIPNSVLQTGCGYFEDRRPASDADPYRVTAAIFSSACLNA
jgi:glutamine synthetase